MTKETASVPYKISLMRDIAGFADFFYKLSVKKPSIRALIYHNVTDAPVSGDWAQMTTPRDLFDRQMHYLKSNGYNVITADQVAELLITDRDIPLRTVTLTFDDGYRDNYRNAFPILRKYGFNATLFVTAGFIGRDKAGGAEYLNWQEAREMRKSGTFTFGCHSFSHRKLARLKKDELIKEIREAKNIIETGLNEKIGIFAYPFGWHNAFDKRVSETLREEGFSCAFTAIHGAITKKSDLFGLRRMRVSWVQEIPEFAKVLRGSYDWYRIYQKAVSQWQRPE